MKNTANILSNERFSLRHSTENVSFGINTELHRFDRQSETEHIKTNSFKKCATARTQSEFR